MESSRIGISDSSSRFSSSECPRRHGPTPLGALMTGLVGGLIGSRVINEFFKRTSDMAPSMPEGIFHPPDEKQVNEQPTETVARRVVEDFMKQGPLSEEQKGRGGEIVHYAFGAGWGALYGMACGSFPRLKSPAGMFGFSTAVAVLSGSVILPAFKLAPSPRKVPLSYQGYSWLSHLSYGAIVWATIRASDLSSSVVSRQLNRRRDRTESPQTMEETERARSNWRVA